MLVREMEILKHSVIQNMHKYGLVGIVRDNNEKDAMVRARAIMDGGVTILDCEAVSRELSDKLDEADLISDAYTLVVSSPGLGRTLTKDRHLENSLGEKVEGKLFKPLAEIGGKEFEGILTAWDAETITIGSDSSITIPRKDIAVLRLYLDL